MEAFQEYLAGIQHPQHQARTREVLDFAAATFPHLAPLIKWNQPMFADHGTFIIGFSTAKTHLAIAPENAAMTAFADDIAQAGYETTKGLIRIRWDQPVDYALLANIMAFNIRDKEDCTTFWRK
ncbi:iron chaperone [Paenibacillus sp. MWE-103]|uniref:Iron chaperone n=1 Tax=Paenibacillus artemisiicola TaxID=1172618 RepID=A0ABS3WJD2_9BACL|nr:iron chaperone [Paenibacillus artemisiicola]MBO7748441.1 iron chaperone [Paenibacillus artemisiicola]